MENILTKIIYPAVRCQPSTEICGTKGRGIRSGCLVDLVRDLVLFSNLRKDLLFFVRFTARNCRRRRVEEACCPLGFGRRLRRGPRGLGGLRNFAFRRSLCGRSLILRPGLRLRSLGCGIHLCFRPVQAVLQPQVRSDETDQRRGQIAVEFLGRCGYGESFGAETTWAQRFASDMAPNASSRTKIPRFQGAPDHVVQTGQP